ncbi:MAG: M42 family metallopeptidase [Candidatus Bipolaricaulia bacterium]
MELLKRLSEAHGISGYEAPVRQVIVEALKDHVDTVEVDHLGNVIAHKKGDGPVVLVAGHMDEIGFLVSHIEKAGFLRIQPVGGFDPVTLVAQRVDVHTSDGLLPGCIGRKPIHILTDEERKKPVKLEDLFVDVGLPGETVCEKVSIGDVVTLRQSYIEYGDVVSGKALDDRLGVYVGIEAMKKAKKLDCDFYLVATTQEEVGLRGAHVSGYSINPDIAIALDVCIAADTADVPENRHVSKQGGGTAITLKDARGVWHPLLVKALRELAEERKIPYQVVVPGRGGTDAAALQIAREGSAAMALCIPTRYVHSVVETVSVKDIEATIDLLAAFLETASSVDLTQ